jgi:uncharacterized membrane protein YjfL (UPF0719 family)
MTPQDIHNMINSLVYSGIGVVILLLTFYLLDLVITKYDLWKEIVEKQNLALAVLLGAAGIGIALIISSAIHG